MLAVLIEVCYPEFHRFILLRVLLLTADLAESRDISLFGLIRINYPVFRGILGELFELFGVSEAGGDSLSDGFGEVVKFDGEFF